MTSTLGFKAWVDSSHSLKFGSVTILSIFHYLVNILQQENTLINGQSISISLSTPDVTTDFHRGQLIKHVHRNNAATTATTLMS